MRVTKFKKITAIALIFVLLLSSISFDIPKAYAKDASDTTIISEYTLKNDADDLPSDIAWVDVNDEFFKTSTIIYKNTTVYYKLTEDITVAYSLLIQSEAVAYIDLNGHDITCTNGSGITVDGVLNLYDSGTHETRYIGKGGVIEDITTLSDSDYMEITCGGITGSSAPYDTYHKAIGANKGGGGVYVRGGIFNMYGGAIFGNSTTETTHQGGGVYVDKNAVFNMYGGGILGNTSASNSGGVYILGTFNMGGDMDDGLVPIIAYNNAPNNFGGGLYVAGSAEMNEGLISHNYAKGSAGVSIIHGSPSNTGFTMNGGEISYNNVSSNGGGILLGDNGKLTMNGGKIKGNTALYNGGGISMTQPSCSVSLNGGEIKENNAEYYGDGIYFGTGELNVSHDATVSENDANVEDNGEGNDSIPDSNVYIGSGNIINVEEGFSGEIGITCEGAVGNVASNADGLKSDNEDLYVITDTKTGVVSIVEKGYFECADKVVTYDGSDVDVTGLFGDYDGTYTIKPIDGVGTLTSENKIDSEVAGSYIVTIEVNKVTDSDGDLTAPPCEGTAMVTILPKEISASGITAVTRGTSNTSRTVELDRSSEYSFMGDCVGDNVLLDFTNAYGLIDDKDFFDKLENDGSTKFDITIYGLGLCGADSGNYTLIDTNGGKSTVTINSSVPYIAWPMTTDIDEGEVKENADLLGGKVVIKVGEDTYLDVTEYGDFEWNADISNQAVGSYSLEIGFVFDDSKEIGGVDSDDIDELKTAVEGERHYVSYDVLEDLVPTDISGGEYTISGNISSSGDDEVIEVLTSSGIPVLLMQGVSVVGTCVTDSNGDYSFSAPNGRYNVVALRDLGAITNTETRFAFVDGGDVVCDITLPDYRKNTSLNVTSGFENVTASGLYGFIENEQSTTIVNVDSVNLDGSAYADILAIAEKNGLTSSDLKLFFDINAMKQEHSDSLSSDLENISEGDFELLENFNKILTFYIPISEDYQGKENYWVYRSNGEAVDVLTAKANSDGEYIEISDDTLIIHAKKSAVYGFAFKNTHDEYKGNVLADISYSVEKIDLVGLDIAKTIVVNGIDEDLSNYDYSFVVNGINGAKGDFDSVKNTLSVKKVGAFAISIVVPESETGNKGDIIITSTLTILPCDVSISGIQTFDRGYVVGNYNVDLDNNTGYIDGAVSSDDVGIDFASASGSISKDVLYTSESGEAVTARDLYDDFTGTDNANNHYFDVKISGITLNGEDKGNYNLVKVGGSSVHIDVAAPLFSWPTAKNVVYVASTTELNDELLYGGKVVVYDDTSIEYINVDGNFVWVDSSFDMNAGTHEAFIKFEPSDRKYDYISNTVKKIGYTVLSAPVKFELDPDKLTMAVDDENSIVDVEKIKAITGAMTEAGDYLQADDYNLIYYYWNMDKVLHYDVDSIDISSSALDNLYLGKYFIGTEFTSDNYRHMGDTVSTSKQICGIKLIESGDVVTKTLKFSNDIADITAYEGQVVNLPTISGDEYIGWELDGKFYDFGGRYAVPDSAFDSDEPIVFTAVEAPETFVISGVVTGTPLGGETGSEHIELNNIAVAVMQGSEIIATMKTGAIEGETAGYYEAKVPAGRYTIMVTRDELSQNKLSEYVEILDSDIVRNFDIPNVVKNVSVSVGAGAGGITVSGVKELASDDKVIDVQVSAADIVVEDLEEFNAIMATAGEDVGSHTLKLFRNINISESNSSGVMTAVSELADSKYLDFYIPLDSSYQNKYDYTVYRYHDGAVDVIKTSKNSDGEYIEIIDGGKTLLMHLRKFSLYGVAFSEEPVLVSSGSFTPALSFNVSYDFNGGSGEIENEMHRSGSIVTLQSEIEKDGYEFIGWECDRDGKIYGDGETYNMISGNVLFTAVWEKVDSPIAVVVTHKVSYVGADYDGTLPNDCYYETGESFTVTSPIAKEGYEFAGWKNSEDGKTYSRGDSIVMGDSDITLSAVWVEVDNSNFGCLVWWIIALLVILIIVLIIIKKRR